MISFARFALSKYAVAGLVLATGLTIAQAAATDPDVIARQDLMKVIGGSTKTLGDMAGGKAAFDATAAQAAKDALVAASMEIEAKFMKETADPEQDASPAVWTNWEDYLAKANALTDAASVVDVTSAESIGAGMQALGGTCSACHRAYRL